MHALSLTPESNPLLSEKRALTFSGPSPVPREIPYVTVFDQEMTYKLGPLSSLLIGVRVADE